MGSSAKERLVSSLQRKREQKQLYNKQHRTSQSKISPTTAYSLKNDAVIKRLHRIRNKELETQLSIKRQNHAAWKKEYRNKKYNNARSSNGDVPFKNRTNKFRAVQRIRRSLPKTPIKRVQVLESYINGKSPTANELKKKRFTEEKTDENVIKNMQQYIAHSKHKRSDDSRTTMNIVCASVSKTDVTEKKCVTKLAKKLGVTPKRLHRSTKDRTQVLRSEKTAFQLTARKTRSDKISDEHRKLAYEFWSDPKNSRPTGNKNDLKREKIGPKQYASHAIHILEKTQTEVYREFKDNYPDIKMGQRVFEKCKPFYVQAVRQKDRQTCCCRAHVEARLLFRQCMDFRRSILKSGSVIDSGKYPVYEYLNDITELTLCEKSEDSNLRNESCLNRTCSRCGVSRLRFLSDEMDISEEGKDVTWECYSYVDVKVKGNKTVRKLQLIKKTTKVGHMFTYFMQLLTPFPSHQFRAAWQTDQLKSLIDNLPQGHAVCVHDYSENYRCSEKTELQSDYFQKQEVTIHVSIIYRHGILEVDEVENELVAEQFLVISPDLDHDRHFTYECQKLIANYLKSISANVAVMHEFTDGCSSQYKSRNCLGDLSINRELGYDLIIRNFFETSHGKGPQDAAGGVR